MQYNIITGTSTDELVKKVKSEIAQGWVPTGGPSCIVRGNVAAFMQAMVKKGEASA